MKSMNVDTNVECSYTLNHLFDKVFILKLNAQKNTVVSEKPHSF